MADDDLFTLIQRYNPELFKMMAESGVLDERNKPLQQRFAIGNEMMQTPMAQGRQVGNTYVASSPFEHLANAFRQVAGARQAQGSMQGENALADQRAKARAAYMGLIAQQQQQPPQLPPDPTSGVVGY